MDNFFAFHFQLHQHTTFNLEKAIMQLPRAAGPLKACQHLMAAASPSTRSVIHPSGPSQGSIGVNGRLGCLQRGLEGFRKCVLSGNGVNGGFPQKKVVCLGSAGSDRMVTTGAAACQEAAVKASSYKPRPRIKEIKVHSGAL